VRNCIDAVKRGENEVNISESRWGRRLGVIGNQGSLLLVILTALAAEFSGWTTLISVLFWLAVAVVLITFYPIYARTGLWRLTHSKVEKLDEREIHLTLGALRFAYTIFAITALASILLTVVFGYGSDTLHLIIFWVLLYLAHTLPSSVVAWSEHHV
jgi:hypothetical protein